jgi:hypothetical protein
MYVETWPANPENTYWTFWGHIKDYDPIPHWQQIIKGKRIPSFVAYGELDELDNAEVVRSQVRMARHLADPLLLFRVYAKTGHGIGSPDRKKGASTYHEEFQRDLRVWLDRLVLPAPAPPAR